LDAQKEIRKKVSKSNLVFKKGRSTNIKFKAKG
jgi:hypothetical protein